MRNNPYSLDILPGCEAKFDMSVDVLKKTEANLNAILNHADSGYVLYDDELKIIAYNALAQEFSHLLYSKTLVEGNHLLSYFPENRHNALIEITRQVMDGKKICYEAYFKIDENEKWIEVRWLNVKNEENKNWGFILASKDITEKKLADIKLEKMTNDLLKRNQALEQFANIISHNLRAPVANILGASGVLSDTDLSLTDKETIINGISTSVLRLDEVVKDLNRILQVKGDINETKEIVHFSTLVEEIKFSVQNLVDKYNIEIKHDFSAINSFLTLRGYLYSIFYNLISNSIKYRKKDTQCNIEIKSNLVNGKLVLIFSDNGMGIDLKKSGDLIFGLYKRFHSNAEGKGLGLFMVKTQVEALGGKISVRSIENAGTEFRIEFIL